MSGSGVRRCRRCLLPATVPGLAFDADDLCDICQATPAAGELAAMREDVRREVAGAIERHRGAHPYECVVAYSGGKDSSYALKLLVEEHRLRCLAVTIDNGFLSADTLPNCRAVCSQLGVDHSLFTPHRGFMERMVRASALDESVHPKAAMLRASSICGSCINLINTHVLSRALELGAPLVAGGYIGGQLPRDAQLLTVRPGLQARVRSATVNRFAAHFGDEARRYFELPTAPDLAEREVVVLNPMLGLSLSEEEILTALAPLGWVRPTDTGVTSTNCRLNDLGVYVHSRRHGFHPYAFEVAEQLRHGLTTREEAQRKLETLPDRADVGWIADRLGLEADAL